MCALIDKRPPPNPAVKFTDNGAAARAEREAEEKDRPHRLANAEKIPDAFRAANTGWTRTDEPIAGGSIPNMRAR